MKAKILKSFHLSPSKIREQTIKNRPSFTSYVSEVESQPALETQESTREEDTSSWNIVDEDEVSKISCHIFVNSH